MVLRRLRRPTPLRPRRLHMLDPTPMARRRTPTRMRLQVRPLRRSRLRPWPQIPNRPAPDPDLGSINDYQNQPGENGRQQQSAGIYSAAVRAQRAATLDDHQSDCGRFVRGSGRPRNGLASPPPVSANVLRWGQVLLRMQLVATPHDSTSEVVPRVIQRVALKGNICALELPDSGGVAAIAARSGRISAAAMPLLKT